jgi:multiple antibiotic resistance protein
VRYTAVCALDQNRTLEHFLQVLIALLAITDPPGAVPAFLALIATMSPEARRRAPLRAALSVTIILAVSLIAGEAVLKVFGISLPAFQAAGGLLLVLMGLEMLRGSPTRVQHDPPYDETVEDQILVPLAMPLIAGPGAIATVITFTARSEGWRGKADIGAAILLTGLAVYVTMRSANWMQKHFSARGQRILIRFMGLILVAVGAQLCLSGVSEFRGAGPQTGSQ